MCIASFLILMNFINMRWLFPILNSSLACSGFEFKLMLWIKEGAHHVVLEHHECAWHMTMVKVI